MSSKEALDFVLAEIEGKIFVVGKGEKGPLLPLKYAFRPKSKFGI